MPRSRRRRGQLVLASLAGIATLLLLAYFAAAVVVYDRISAVGVSCADPHRIGTPSRLPAAADARFAVYRAPRWESVSFPSREAGIELRGTWVPATARSRDAVIVVHGLATCRHELSVLVPAGMLHRDGFSVLLVDLRDHGESTREDGRFAGGTEEFRDVLGAWNWLRGRGLAAEAIGLAGVSMGAASVLVAAAEEPAVAAVWADSGFASVNAAVRDELARNGYPTELSPGGLLVARFISGDDLSSRSPLAAAAALPPRPLAITHGAADTRLAPHFANDLANAYRGAGGTVDVWLIQGAEHVEGMLLEPSEYERRLSRFFAAALRR